MNSITITVPWLPMLVCLGVISGFLIIRSAIGRGRARIRAWKIAGEVRKANERAAEAEELLRKLSLFPSPWDQAYKKCCAIEGNPESGIWFRQWLRRHDTLPAISIEAITEFCCQLTIGQSSSRWGECLDLLAPYVDTAVKSESSVVQKFRS